MRVARTARSGSSSGIGVCGALETRRSQRGGIASTSTLALVGRVGARVSGHAGATGNGRVGGAVHGIASRACVATLRRGLAWQRKPVVAAVADRVLVRAEGVGGAKRAVGSTIEDVSVVTQTLILIQV